MRLYSQGWRLESEEIFRESADKELKTYYTWRGSRKHLAVIGAQMSAEYEREDGRPMDQEDLQAQNNILQIAGLRPMA